MVPKSHICISSALQHPDIGCIKSSCCEAVSNGVNVLAQGMMRCSPVAEQYCIEGPVLHLHVNGFAVRFSRLLMSLLLESCIASLQQVSDMLISSQTQAFRPKMDSADCKQFSQCCPKHTPHNRGRNDVFYSRYKCQWQQAQRMNCFRLFKKNSE